MWRSEPHIADCVCQLTYAVSSRICYRTSCCHLDNSVVWMLDLRLGDLANANLKGLLIVDGFHDGRGGGIAEAYKISDVSQSVS